MNGHAHYQPFTGCDPMDGDDPRVTLSRDNPMRRPVTDDPPAPR